jgi:hypothetical protein
MAARRLIAILLVLLFLSSLAAALAPVQDRAGTESSSTSTTTEPATLPEADTPGDARVVTQSVDASAPRPAMIRARVGDRLRLRVTSHRPGTVELVGLGPAEDVGPRQPALFDVFLRDGGSYPVQFLDTERDVAQIEVSPPRTEPALR